MNAPVAIENKTIDSGPIASELPANINPALIVITEDKIAFKAHGLAARPFDKRKLGGFTWNTLTLTTTLVTTEFKGWVLKAYSWRPIVPDTWSERLLIAVIGAFVSSISVQHTGAAR